MLTRDELGRVRVVLVGARNPNNVGAAARAMQDFGFSDLRLVNEYRVPLETARSAVGAADLLASAVESASAAEAVAGCSLVVGTTAVGERGIEHRLVGLVEAAKEIKKELGIGNQADKRLGIKDQGLAGSSLIQHDEDAVVMNGALNVVATTHVPESGHGAPDSVAGSEDSFRVALLFGSEKTGLTNDALSHCNWLLTVPLHRPEDARHLSMNLGQAVAVCLWELVRGEGAVEAHLSDDGPLAKAEECERVTGMLREVMSQTEYNRRFPASCDENTVRRLVRRMRLNARDAQAWMGILRQMLWKLKGS